MEIEREPIKPAGILDRLNPLIKRAHKVGKSAVTTWRDNFDSQFHTERIRRHEEDKEILETFAMREVAEHSGNHEDAILQTESLCAIFGNSLCRNHEIGDIKRIAWCREYLIELRDQLSNQSIEHLFKPEQNDIINRYLDIPFAPNE